MVKKLWRYFKPFSSDTGMLRTDRQICYINIARQPADARYKSTIQDRDIDEPPFQFIHILSVLVFRNFHVLSKYLARSNSLPNFSIVSLCIMQLCEYVGAYVFLIGFLLYVPKNGVLRVKIWTYCVLTPKRHYPAWIRVCWCIVCQNRFNGLSSRSAERFCLYEEIKKTNKWLLWLYGEN